MKTERIFLWKLEHHKFDDSLVKHKSEFSIINLNHQTHFSHSAILIITLPLNILNLIRIEFMVSKWKLSEDEYGLES